MDADRDTRSAPSRAARLGADRLTCRRTNHDQLHVRGYKEEGTTTTPFDMVMRNDLDRFHLVMDVIGRAETPAGPGYPGQEPLCRAASIAAASLARAEPYAAGDLEYFGKWKVWPYLIGYGYVVTPFTMLLI